MPKFTIKYDNEIYEVEADDAEAAVEKWGKEYEDETGENELLSKMNVDVECIDETGKSEIYDLNVEAEVTYNAYLKEDE